MIIRGVGFAAVPDEAGLTAAARTIPPGLYALPAPPDWRREATTNERMTAWEARFRSGPAGLLVVRPHGEGPFSSGKLLVRLAANVVAVLLALFVVSVVPGSRRRHAATVTATGVTGLATVGVLSWNWYASTDAFFAAQCVDVLGGWLIVGAVLAALVPPPDVPQRGER